MKLGIDVKVSAKEYIGLGYSVIFLISRGKSRGRKQVIIY